MEQKMMLNTFFGISPLNSLQMKSILTREDDFYFTDWKKVRNNSTTFLSFNWKNNIFFWQFFVDIDKQQETVIPNRDATVQLGAVSQSQGWSQW